MANAASDSLPVLAFADRTAFERWMEQQPADSPGLWLKFAKVTSGVATVSKAEAIDVALCHGWIDGQLKPFDESFWLVRFTPRKARSKWSAINRARALQLAAEGRMTSRGQSQIDAAVQDGRWEAAYASQSQATVPDDLAAALAAEPSAKAMFETLDPANRYAVLYRVHNAGKPDTRAKRIATLIAMLARGETIHPPRRKS
jgi:uncharacterized protein YdeI (YjbR/CyaY-like superfamily)